jgi:hypothetical protein
VMDRTENASCAPIKQAKQDSQLGGPCLYV